MLLDCVQTGRREGDEWEFVVVHRTGGDLAVLRPFGWWEGDLGNV